MNRIISLRECITAYIQRIIINEFIFVQETKINSFIIFSYCRTRKFSGVRKKEKRINTQQRVGDEIENNPFARAALLDIPFLVLFYYIISAAVASPRSNSGRKRL